MCGLLLLFAVVVVVDEDKSSELRSKSFLRIELFSSFLLGDSVSFSCCSIKNCFSSGILVKSKLDGNVSVVCETR